MNTTTAFHPHPVRRLAPAVAAVALALAATACSSQEDTTSSPTSQMTATSPPTTGAAPPTSPAPPTTAPVRPSTTLAPSTSAAAPPTTAVDEERRALLAGILGAHQAAGEFVGARIALLDANGAVTEVTAGTATVDPASAPVDPAVAWNVGSVTKTFVAVVALQLAEEGRLELDDGIERFFPALPDAGRITPRQLLQHTSGLREYIDAPAVVGDMQREWTPTELLAVAEATGRAGEPGGAYHYSNTNYILLGEIIEQVTGRSWDDEVRTRIVEPLGMTDTSVIAEPVPGYQIVGGSFVDATLIADPSIGGAGGALQSTGRDLVRFARALVDGTLLSAESQQAMETVVPGEDYSQFGITHSYGLGIEQFAKDAMVVKGHMGTGQAQSAFLGYDRDHGTAVVVMTNTAVPGPQAFMALEALAAATGAG